LITGRVEEDESDASEGTSAGFSRLGRRPERVEEDGGDA
jgi:hypothetical protein